MGEEIVQDRLSLRTLNEYKRYITLFFQSYDELSRDTLRQALMAYEVKATEERDYYTAKRMLHQALISVARLYVYQGKKEPGFAEQLQPLRPKRGLTKVNRHCYQIETIDRAIEQVIMAKTKNQADVYNEYNKTLNILLIRLAYETGARNSEICGIRLQDIDFRECSIRLFGKGNKERYIGLGLDLLKLVKAFLTIRKPSESDCLLISELGTPIRSSYFSRRMRRLNKHLDGIKFQPHGLRRTAITHMLTVKKLPVPIVRDAVGHSSIAITDIYARPTANDVIRLMRES